MAEPLFTWRNRIFKRSVIALAVMTVVFVLVGFVWLPSQQKDFTVQGLWAGICRAAGVPTKWNGEASDSLEGRTTQVVLDRSMARAGASDAVGRGATLALNCTMCHGALGMSTSNAPNLAGQYPEVIIKQLEDYRSGHRSSAIMEAIAKTLSDEAIRDLAAYYAYLPKARTAPTTYDEKLPALVRVGDPLRNIAPCISCHGQVDQKLGAPWLEGMPKQYLVNQLNAFIAGTRRNDSEAQMRNVARTMTPQEIDEVATFYARKASPAEGAVASTR
ncbi:MAG TPA: c-type cytochrome [Steroidobacteraceae bacterium]|nr:c-type cytochrome [Steroidobacteraceae bacterium]